MMSLTMVLGFYELMWPFGTKFPEIFQKLRILEGTILYLIPALILEYLAVSTERPVLFFQNCLMKINEWVDNSVNYQITFWKMKISYKMPKMCKITKVTKNQEIMKSNHFLNELSLTICTGFLWVSVTIWHWVCSNIQKKGF